MDSTGGRQSIVSRKMDFWLLGGASIVFYFVTLFTMTNAGFQIENELYLDRYLYGLVFLAFVFNYPHFIVSYKIAYGRGREFIQRHWIKLILLPVLLVATFILAVVLFHTPVGKDMVLNQILQSVGLKYRFGAGGILGKELIGLTLWITFGTIGWHYSKQVYGCLMVYSRYDKFPLTSLERTLLKASLYSIALYQFVAEFYPLESRSQGGIFRQGQFRMYELSVLGLSQEMVLVAKILVWVFMISAGILLMKKRLQLGVSPSPQFLVIWIAFLFWWGPVWRNSHFLFRVVPIFHALQYLPFAMKLENKGRKGLVINLAIFLVLGVVFFKFLPQTLDAFFDSEKKYTKYLFSTLFAVFFNIHHFLVDSVIWKFDAIEVRENLLGENRELIL